MSYNQQVTDNINQLKRQVKEAKSQDQLVNIIQSVQAHTGPLDYKDTALTIILWSFLLLGSVMLFLGVTDTYLPIITQIIGYTCYSAHSWLPALVVYILPATARRKK
ncbi:hypothetical protein [Litoribacillus peritrichatus]|uniref:Uncharacterized protein n=1 Tax=Litoribacillus peritrichatus TaxID=718191 RepID=A0ABP7MBV4_9GAMM